MREYFDFNVMLGKPTVASLDNWLDIERLREEMDRFNIKSVLVYHSYSKDYDAFFGNNYLIKEIKDQSDIYPCWILLPMDIYPIGNLQELYNDLKQNNIKAIRLFPEYHNFLLEEEVIGNLFSFLEEIRIPVLLSPNRLGWKEVFSILRNHPNLKLVLLELTYRNNGNLFPLLKNYSNVFIELSGYIPFLGIEGIYKRFGAERILFGSNLPYKSPGATIFYIENADILEESKDLIAYENAMRLIKEVKL
jgi:hypothetical protein